MRFKQPSSDSNVRNSTTMKCKTRISIQGVAVQLDCNKPATYMLDNVTPLCSHCSGIAQSNGLSIKYIHKYKKASEQKSSWSQKPKTDIERYKKKPDMLGKNES